MKPKRKRKYGVDKLTASSHPLRLTLLDLIKQGINTAPKMAEVLNENRMNLYHHLNYLEKSGIITSFFVERVKTYRMAHELSERVNQNTLTDTRSIILSPSIENNIEFTSVVDNLLSISGVKREQNSVITQVQVIIKSAKANVLMQQNIQKVQALEQIYDDQQDRKV